MNVCCNALLIAFVVILWSSRAVSAGQDDYAAQAKDDAKLDTVHVIFSGKSPNKLVCDTMLRQVPDGSWVMVMLGGGDTEPKPSNRVFITRSTDPNHKIWSPMQPIDLGVKNKEPDTTLVPSELMVHKGCCTLFFSTHNGRFGNWKSWYTQSRDSCRTWGPLIPAPGELHLKTFIRNHIVTRDGRIMLPFQHYLGGGPGTKGCVDPRVGVIISSDGGLTWSVCGSIRLSDRDNYLAWAEPSIVELADGTIAMVIRGGYPRDGVLSAARSKDGGLTWPEYAVKINIPNPASKAVLYGLGDNRVAILHNPNPKHRTPLSLWISFDGMKSWPYRRDLITWPANVQYPDGFVSEDKEYLHFAFDDNRCRAVYVGAKLPPLSRSPKNK